MKPRPRQRTDQPHRHILVAVLGQTPQIITETLYALMVKRRPPIPISEVFIVTTKVGAERARSDLLDPESGQFFSFCREYGFDPKAIAFDAAHIITIKKCAGRDSGFGARQNRRTPNLESRATELDDIRTVAENQLLAEQLFGIIRELTADPSSTLHCSIAGGRKTMSAYMALALTLYGREQDGLYHVLVPEVFESNRKFFFPPRRNTVIGIKRGEEPDVAHTKEARIDLAEIPFVRVRPLLGKKAGRLDQTVEEQIRVVQYELNRQSEQSNQLLIDYRAKEARFGERLLPLTGVQLALVAYFAERRAEHIRHTAKQHGVGPCIDCFQPFAELDLNRYSALYQLLASSPAAARERAKKRQAKGNQLLDSELFLSYLSKLNQALEREGMNELRIVNVSPTPRNARYGLQIDPARIELTGEINP